MRTKEKQLGIVAHNRLPTEFHRDFQAELVGAKKIVDADFLLCTVNGKDLVAAVDFKVPWIDHAPGTVIHPGKCPFHTALGGEFVDFEIFLVQEKWRSLIDLGTTEVE